MPFEIAAIVAGTTTVVTDTVLAVGGGVGVAVAGSRLGEVARSVRSRMAGRLPLPVNHDLVIGIRTAHLAAVDRIARRNAKVIEA